jgi:type VI protein secretion system component VasK
MSLRDRIEDAPDAALEQALKNFRSSVHAWSEAAYSRPRTAVSVVRHRSWRLAASCALGCALVAGSVTGVVHERHHRQEMAMAAARAAEHERQVAAERARVEDEDLLATVDSDVSREVPSALEPLAQLMVEDEAKVSNTSK